jgi:hypothetical protein
MIKYLKECIQNEIAVTYIRFGDGEYGASNFYGGCNAGDMTPYTHKLCSKINESIRYFADKKNILWGKWGREDIVIHFENVANAKLNWVDFHFFHPLQEDIKCSDPSQNDKILLLKSIKDSKLKKVFVGNYLLEKTNLLLNTDKHIKLDPHDWYENSSDEIIKQCVSEVSNSSEKVIFLFSGGMGSKCIMAEMHALYPNLIYLDLGSSLDWVCTKRDSRGWSEYFSYEEVLLFFKPILPDTWDDPKYDWIYPIAKKVLGLHLNF